MRTLVVSAVACLTLTGLSYAQDVKASIKQYQIAAQPLAEALRAFAEQSDMQLIFSEAEMANAKSEGVDGALTAQEALQALLKGTSLGFELTENNVVVVRKEKLGARTIGLQRARASGIRIAQTESGTAGSTPAGAESVELEEIVVTAQKREYLAGYPDG